MNIADRGTHKYHDLSNRYIILLTSFEAYFTNYVGMSDVKMVTESNFQVKIILMKVILAVVVDVIISRVLLLLLVEKLVITCLKCAKLEPFFVVSGGKVLWQASIVYLLLFTFHFLTIFVLTCINTSHTKLVQLTQSCERCLP